MRINLHSHEQHIERLPLLKILKSLTLALTTLAFACTNQGGVKDDKTTNVNKVNAYNQEIFALIKGKDSLLFQIGFNQIDTVQVVKLISTNFEFYHDQHGITETQSRFIKNIDGMRELPFKIWRVLVDGTMEVFPLYQENSQILYGAIQNGVHEFYQQIEGKAARKTNRARFTHLWIIENGEWKLTRVLSYDHKVPD